MLLLSLPVVQVLLRLLASRLSPQPTGAKTGHRLVIAARVGDKPYKIGIQYPFVALQPVLPSIFGAPAMESLFFASSTPHATPHLSACAGRELTSSSSCGKIFSVGLELLTPPLSFHMGSGNISRPPVTLTSPHALIFPRNCLFFANCVIQATSHKVQRSLRPRLINDGKF